MVHQYSKTEFAHTPVMATEIVECFRNIPSGIILDGTLGGGGHAANLLEAFTQIVICGVDRDLTAIEAAKENLRSHANRTQLFHGTWSHLSDFLEQAKQHFGDAQLVGAFFDLGVSSPQIDHPERGFSYRSDGPLDMRMDSGSSLSAMSYVNEAPVEELTSLFVDHGEGRFAKRVALAIEAQRPISRTGELADLITRAVPRANRRKGHPAKRYFQALRVVVNDEEGQLDLALEFGLSHLNMRDSRFAVISYQSGEDKKVKTVFTNAINGGCVCPPQLPCVCGARGLWQRGRVPKKPTDHEITSNPRSMSARLRMVSRLEDAI